MLSGSIPPAWGTHPCTSVAFSNDRRLHDVAHDVVDRTLRFS
jgi:hypothetical protein